MSSLLDIVSAKTIRFSKMNEHSTPAVKIRCAEKCYVNKYGTKPTFSGLNLNLPSGNIYALLGPSGCGKTTLLRCILGRLKLDKGSVLVFGCPPGSKESGIPGPTVGYMAQETTVYLTMTIGEYLWYYGTIFGLSSEQINLKTIHFIKMLNLPSKNTRTSTLSGGQLRRVQFATALIHDPKLVILDEPTVGIEVTTKQIMWQHLVNLTKDNGSTVLLTTHYIEEARLADRVGMMHNCKMAAEDTTSNLLRKYGETTLEDVFLKICYNFGVDVVVDSCARGDVEINLSMHRAGSEDNNHNAQAKECGGNDGLAEKSRKLFTNRVDLGIAWHRLFPIFMRNCYGLLRFPGALLCLLLLPCIQVYLMQEALGSLDGAIPVVIVNEDVGEIGRQYLSYLNPDVIRQKPYQNYDDGLEATRQGEAYAVLHIKHNFSSVFYKRYTDFAIASAQILDGGTLKLKVDNTNLNIAKMAELHVLETYQHFLIDTLRSAGINPMVVQSPINISEEVVKGITRSPRVHVMSGFLAQNSYFSAIPLAIFSIFIEKHKGFMEPNLIAGVTFSEIILGTMLFQAVLIAVQNAAAILIALPLLNEFNKGSVILISSLLYLHGFSGTTFGILMSVIIEEPMILFGCIVGIMCLFSGLSGIFWPIEAMPAVWRNFCKYLPNTLPGRAIGVITHRGWDIRHFEVYGAFGISFMWLFVFLAMSVWIFSRKK